MAEDMPKKFVASSNVHGQLLRAKGFDIRARGWYAIIKNLFARKTIY
jgi:hypothetical protein